MVRGPEEQPGGDLGVGENPSGGGRAVPAVGGQPGGGRWGRTASGVRDGAQRAGFPSPRRGRRVSASKMPVW